MRREEIARLLDTAAEDYRREAVELTELADIGEPDGDATREADSLGQHPADAASDTVEREIDLGLRLDTVAVLAEITDAMRRLADGTYGRCETCGRAIDEARLRAVPWARRCIADERSFERASTGLPQPSGQRVWPVDDEQSTGDAVWDPEDDHPVPCAEESAVHAEAS